jgi:hypothetical protein
MTSEVVTLVLYKEGCLLSFIEMEKTAGPGVPFSFGTIDEASDFLAKMTTGRQRISQKEVDLARDPGGISLGRLDATEELKTELACRRRTKVGR